jgi:hypothetical protein
MTAFISYSIDNGEDILISLLANQLQQAGFQTETSNDFYAPEPGVGTRLAIANAALFVGVATRPGRDTQRVLQEWRVAEAAKVPRLMLMEQHWASKVAPSGNIVFFDRQNPGPALGRVADRLESARQPSTPDLLPWLLGGAALVAVLSFLDRSK